MTDENMADENKSRRFSSYKDLPKEKEGDASNSPPNEFANKLKFDDEQMKKLALHAIKLHKDSMIVLSILPTCYDMIALQATKTIELDPESYYKTKSDLRSFIEAAERAVVESKNILAKMN